MFRGIVAPREVRIATPAFSAANLALSSMDRARWAFIPSLMFGYRGDDMPQHRRRCFQLEVFCPEKFAAQKKRPSPSTYTWKIPEEMEADGGRGDAGGRSRGSDVGVLCRVAVHGRAACTEATPHSLAS